MGNLKKNKKKLTFTAVMFHFNVQEKCLDVWFGFLFLFLNPFSFYALPCMTDKSSRVKL